MPQYSLKALLVGTIFMGFMMWLNMYPVVVSVREGDRGTGVLYASGFPMQIRSWIQWNWPKMPARVLENGYLEVAMLDENDLEIGTTRLVPLTTNISVDKFPVTLGSATVVKASWILNSLAAIAVALSAALCIEFFGPKALRVDEVKWAFWSKMMVGLCAGITGAWMSYMTYGPTLYAIGILLGPWGPYTMEYNLGLGILITALSLSIGIAWKLHRVSKRSVGSHY